jgi:nucleotide-binding universal stress UspA family protein
MTITSILCPTDFSDASAHAIDLATAIARSYRAPITALHVLDPMFLMVPEIGVTDPTLEDRERARLRQEADADFAAARKAGVTVEVVIDVGRPAPCILERASMLPAGLIVMGTHGASGFERLVLGSVTEKVLRKAVCPVLTVPPREDAPGTRVPFRRVLCAVDFSEASATALAYAVSLAEESGAALTLLHVIEWPWEEPPPPRLDAVPPAERQALAEYHRYTEAGARARLDSLVPASTRLARPPAVDLRTGKPYVEILAAAGEADVDLIVMGVRGRSPIDLTIFGSTANHVVRRAGCPVLTIRRSVSTGSGGKP